MSIAAVHDVMLAAALGFSIFLLVSGSYGLWEMNHQKREQARARRALERVRR